MTKTNNNKETNNTTEANPAPPAFPQALLDHVIANYKKPSDLIGENGMLKQLTKAVFEAALNAEMAEHLGHARHESVANPTGNVRNGHSAKTISGDFGEVTLAVPRDRAATFAPQLMPKHQRRMPGFDERILSLYARGMSTREIGAHLLEMFGTEVSPALISAITDTVADREIKGVEIKGVNDELISAPIKSFNTFPLNHHQKQKSPIHGRLQDIQPQSPRQ